MDDEFLVLIVETMRYDFAGILGRIAGYGLAPLVAAGSAMRRSQLFHPVGIVLTGMATPDAQLVRAYPAVARLSGPVLARFSGGFWKQREWLDVLGCALRFGDDAGDRAQPSSGDQDLLLATIRHPLTTLAAAWSTQQRDYLGNHYFGVSPFQLPDVGRIHVRGVPQKAAREAYAEPTREARLRAALGDAPVRVALEGRGGALGRSYRTLTVLELSSELALVQRTLQFDPFRCGRGLQPVGFTHHLRFATYRASRWARPR